jgi:hypothetical protein
MRIISKLSGHKLCHNLVGLKSGPHHLGGPLDWSLQVTYVGGYASNQMVLPIMQVSCQDSGLILKFENLE